MHPNQEQDRLRPVLTFDATRIEPRDRFELWNARTASSFELLLPPGTAPHELRTSSQMWDMGSHVMMTGDYTPVTSRRPRHLAVADQFDHFVLRMNIERPGAQCDANGKRMVLAEREAVLLDMRLPSTYTSPGGKAVVAFLPRSELESHLPGRRDLHGAVPQGACAQLLADHLLSLARNVHDLTAQEARGAAKATLALLVAGLMTTRQSLEWGSPEVEDALLTRICQFVHRNVADPDLSVAMICGSFKVSRATLYRLFEPIGGVVQFIKEQRLRRVHADILANAGTSRKLASLAEDMGFKDPAHFSRLFKQHFGYSPSEAATRVPSRLASVSGSDAAVYFARLRSLQR